MGTRYGSIVISIFVQRNGIQEPTVHPLMSRSPGNPLRAWNTGFIYYTIKGEHSQQWDMPNWINIQERMMLTWSPRWMDSVIDYTGRTGEVLAMPRFTWEMDGVLRTERFDFFDGFLIWKYAGRWEETEV